MELEGRSENFDPSEYWVMHPFQPATIAYTTVAKAAENPPQTKPLYNAYEGDLCGRQLSETVPAFLARCPPLTTHVSTYGPWIRIGNPYTTFRHANEDQQGFMIRGRELLEDFSSVKAGIEASMAGKSKVAITRKLMPLRKQLEIDILAAAREHGCTSGKWMLFPHPDYVNSFWSLVATATANDELGIAAKVAADEGDPDKARLICVYTENFEDKADVKRVLERLLAMGLCNRNGAMAEGRTIYYKVDAYTYLDIMGGNEWGLKASLYSSREILGE